MLIDIWLISVSFCLFYNEVIDASSSTETFDSESFIAATLNRRTLLKPYLSEYNYLYVDPDNQNMGRRVFSATLKNKIIDSFGIQKWLEIENCPKTTNINDDEVSPSVDPAIFNIYANVALLLIQKMQKWAKSRDPIESIEYYLGFEKKTVDIINISMTELFSRQRKNAIRIDSLAQMFYYSCDVKNTVIKRNVHRPDLVQRFSYFQRKFWNFLTPDALSQAQDTFVENIKFYLRSIGEMTKAPFGITISSMKMMILTNKSVDEHVLFIQNRESHPLTVMTLHMYADSYLEYDEGNKINAFHFRLLSVVAKHVFGYVLNHFELLSKLRQYNVDVGDKMVMEPFKKFINAYMSVFIDRYFEFKGEISQQMVDALFPLLYFMEPNDPQIPDVKNLTEEEKRELNKHTTPKFSMDNYFTNPQKDDEFDQHMRGLIDNAVEIFVNSFPEEDTDGSKWNDLLKIKYEKPLDKKLLLQYMATNIKNAINILVKFAREFTIDQQLYKKYGLNNDLSTPLAQLKWNSGEFRSKTSKIKNFLPENLKMVYISA